ncbi:hypothetical protein B0H14DRAFT_3649620 [Mycena olivaceomarginata]|nr:hypothetical protein B0H14DRAFT_3649620 [Mycena olivaceomarginata]
MSARRTFTPASYACPEPSCKKLCKTAGGLKQHRESAHPRLPQVPVPGTVAPAPLDNSDDRLNNHGSTPSPPASPPTSPRHSPPPERTIPENRRGTKTTYHSLLDGTPCDRDGYDLPPGSPPPPWEERAKDYYSPFDGRAEFEFAELFYTHEEMAQSRVDRLAQLLAALYPGQDPPSFSVQYLGPLPEGEVPEWMTQKYEVWFRSPLGIFEKQLANPDFKDEIDWAPKRIFKDGKRQFVDLFSGNWVWKEADKIAEDPNTRGAMYVPSVLGSDKTTVSVGTGNTEFYPLYGGVRNLFKLNPAHSSRWSLNHGLSFYSQNIAFRKFRRQLFHSSLARILEPLKPHMTVLRVTRCADGHFRREIYGIGPYIADYPEQALLTCIVQRWCPRCLSPADNLDSPSDRRSHDHTDGLLQGCTLKELWDDFGIVGDLIDFREQTSTN